MKNRIKTDFSLFFLQIIDFSKGRLNPKSYFFIYLRPLKLVFQVQTIVVGRCLLV